MGFLLLLLSDVSYEDVVVYLYIHAGNRREVPDVLLADTVPDQHL